MCYLLVGKLNMTWNAAGLLHSMLEGHGLIMQLQLGIENRNFFVVSTL